MRSLMVRATILSVLLVCWSGAALAQGDAPAKPAPAARGEWESVDLSPDMSKKMRGEGFESSTLVAAAYGFIWVMVCGFMVSVWLRGRKVERELSDLEQRIARSARSDKP
jgi:hypothetical protein